MKRKACMILGRRSRSMAYICRVRIMFLLALFQRLGIRGFNLLHSIWESQDLIPWKKSYGQDLKAGT